MVSRYVPSFPIGLNPGNPSGHQPPPTHVGSAGGVPLGMAMAATAVVAAAAANSVPSQQQAQQQAASQTLKGPQQPPPNPNDYHVQQCLVQGPPPSTGPPQAPPPHQQHYRILHSTNGYVAAQSAGYSGPQPGPPHQGSQVIRGIQSGAPPTPPQQDLNKMQQPPPQQMFVPAGGANGSGNVRQTPQLYRGGTSSTAASRAPRQQNLAMPPMYISGQPVVMPHTTFHGPYAAASRQQTTGFVHFPNSQLPGFSGCQYFIHSAMMPGAHRGAAVPNQMVSNATPGMQTPVAQGQMVPSCVLAAPGQQPHMPPAGTEKKKRAHALPIIDPITKKNVLDDLDSPKSQTTSATTLNETVEYRDQFSQSPEVSELSPMPSQEQISGTSSGNGAINTGSMINNSRQINYGTDVVSNKISQGLDTSPATTKRSDESSTDARSQHTKAKKRKSDDIITIHPPPPASAESPGLDSTVSIASSDLVENYEEDRDEDVLMEAQLHDGYHGKPIESNTTSALQLEPDLVQDSSLGTQSPVPFIPSIQSSSTSIGSGSAKSIPSASSSSSSVCSRSSASTIGNTYSGNVQQNKPFSTLSAASAPFSSASSSTSIASQSSFNTTNRVTTPPSVYGSGEIAEDTKSVGKEVDNSSPRSAEPVISLASSTVSSSTVLNARVSGDSKNLASPSPIASNTQSVKSKDFKDLGSATSTSSSGSLSQESQSSKMTLNEKEVSKSASATSHGKTISPAFTSDRKESKGTGTVVNSKKPPPGTSDRNDNIIPINESDQNTQPSKKSSTTHTPDLPSANNNADNISVTSYDPSILASPTDDRSEASLNNNNMCVESKTSTDSIQSLSTVTSIDPSITESIDSAETPYDSSSDLNDNRMMGATQGESSTESTETDSTAISSTILPPSADEAETASISSSVTIKSNSQPAALIKYNEGQWSPFNQDGSRTYDRSQLFALRESPASKHKPEVAPQILRPTTTDSNIQQQHSLLPSFASVRRHHLGSQSGGIQTSLRSGTSASGAVTSGPPGTQYGKQASMPGVAGKSCSRGSKTGMIYLNLSLGEEVKLTETENAWRPTRLRENENIPAEERSKDQLIRKVRGILNKLTPEKFEILVDQIMSMQINTAEKIVGVMELVFEKAIDEPAFSYSYARLCQKLIEKKLQSIRRDSTMSAAEEKASNMVVFRNALLDKTQREFQENVLAREAKENQLGPIIERINECADIEKKLELQATLEEQERKIRRRSGGTVRFIGELFKMNILNIKVTKDCIQNLLDSESEDKLECLCKLLTTVGKSLEKLQQNDLDQTMKTMKSIVDRKKISSRVRFMLQDVIDLRKNKWESKRAEMPTTMEQIQKEAESEQMNSQMLNYNIMSNKKEDRRYGGGGSGGSGGGGGNSGGGSGPGMGGMMSSGVSGGSNNYNKNNSDTWYTKTSKGNRAVDANKLGHMITCVNENPTKLGDVSLYQWNLRSSDNHSSGSKSFSTTMNSFAALSNLDSNKGSSSGPRNKGSYSKNSMERERHDRPQSRTGSTHGSRENSSSRAARGASNTARSASHSYSSTPASRTVGAKSISDTTRGDRGTLERMDRTRDRESRPDAEIQYPDDGDTTNRLIKELVTKALEKYIDECPNIMKRYPEKSRWQFFYHIFCDYLHLSNTKSKHRRILAQVFMLFFKQNLVTKDDFLKGYSEFSQIAHEILIDVPEAWGGIFQFLVPLIYKAFVPISCLWNDELQANLGEKFIKDLVVYCTREVGPHWTRIQWQNSDFKWCDFMPQEEVEQFVKENKFEFLENKDAAPPIMGSVDMNSVMERVKDLLTDVGKEEIHDYLNGNIANVDKQFIRALTTTVCNFAIKHINKNHKLDKKTFTDVCVPLLNRYIDSKEELELECLFAIQVLIIKLEHPQGVLSELFAEMYENDVITPDSFLKWKDSKEEPNGKGVAVKGLTHFFRELALEISDENN